MGEDVDRVTSFIASGELTQAGGATGVHGRLGFTELARLNESWPFIERVDGCGRAFHRNSINSSERKWTLEFTS